jgi:SAM-dependent methyltransferase
MEGFGPSTYGDGFADVYEQWYGTITDAETTAAFVAARVGDGPVLELGVGNGRLVGPLRSAGLEVIGIDASAAMLEQCRERHSTLPVMRADLAQLPVAGPIGGALCAFNTLFNLPNLPQQQQLLGSIAAALAPDGVLVIEAMTGNGLENGPRSSVGVSKMATDRLVLSATLLDENAQTIQGQHVDIGEGSITLRPWMLRWTTPPELDHAAAQVGLVLTERFGGWLNEPFDPEGETHVSVFRHP